MWVVGAEGGPSLQLLFWNSSVSSERSVFSGETCLSIIHSPSRGSWSVEASTVPGLMWLCSPVAVSFQWVVAHLFPLSDVFSISPVGPQSQKNKSSFLL